MKTYHELFLAWRYLFAPVHSAWLRAWVMMGLVAMATGLGLFYGTSHREIGGLVLVVGTLIAATSGLLSFFRVFTAIAMIGLAIGFAVMISVLSVTQGFQEVFRDKILGVNAHVLVMKYGLDFVEHPEVISKLEQQKTVASASPFLFQQMMVANGNALSGVLVKGIDPARAPRVLDFPSQLTHWTNPNSPPQLTELLGPRGLEKGVSHDAKGQHLADGIILGYKLAEKLNVKLGGTMRLMSPFQGRASNDVFDAASRRGQVPRMISCRVQGIFDSGFEEYDARLVYVNLIFLQRFLQQGDAVTGVELKLHDPAHARKTAVHLGELLGGVPYRVIDWSELNANLFRVMRHQRLLLQIVIGFIVLVAAFNVLAALAVLVIRKQREIAILKSMGATRASMTRIFRHAGLVVWAVGTGLGASWGFFGSKLLGQYGFPLDPKIYLIRRLPVHLNVADFAYAATFALIICLLATIYPASRAARVSPVEGVRGA